MPYPHSTPRSGWRLDTGAQGKSDRPNEAALADVVEAIPLRLLDRIAEEAAGGVVDSNVLLRAAVRGELLLARVELVVQAGADGNAELDIETWRSWSSWSRSSPAHDRSHWTLGVTLDAEDASFAPTASEPPLPDVFLTLAGVVDAESVGGLAAGRV